jgi:hypothetical protein
VTLSSKRAVAPFADASDAPGLSRVCDHFWACPIVPDIARLRVTDRCLTVPETKFWRFWTSAVSLLPISALAKGRLPFLIGSVGAARVAVPPP